jgi:hypothetical protein
MDTSTTLNTQILVGSRLIRKSAGLRLNVLAAPDTPFENHHQGKIATVRKRK